MTIIESNPVLLEQIWSMMLQDTFDTFSKQHLGFIDDQVPPCYETGDGHSYCLGCPWQPTC